MSKNLSDMLFENNNLFIYNTDRPCGMYSTKEKILEFSTNSRTHASEDYVVVSIDVPGVKKEDIEITLANNILSVAAKRKDLAKEYVYMQSWRISDNVCRDQITSKLEDGVLKINIPTQQKDGGQGITIPVL
jgi:HSP20 family protein